MDAITVKNLGKAYKQYHSKWGRLAEWFLPGNKQRHNQHWILNDVNFTIQSGEAVGIIGVNGAGKSTLLKMITGTTQPTTGTISINGRIAALLELGMGFHPDFTGRENVFMAGQLMGLSVEKIQTLMPEIEAFAEIGNYIDQPVRVYSSGMQVRLAFSVATASRPDILIIDEALSVGDAYFQHKSFNRIKKYSAQGTTLLLVSHDKQAIQSVCSQAILLNTGKIQMVGNPEAVTDYYNALLADKSNSNITQVNYKGIIQTISGTGEATVIDIGIYDSDGKKIETVSVGQEVTLKILVFVKEAINKLVLGYSIKNRLGQVIFGTNTSIKKLIIEKPVVGSNYLYKSMFKMNIGVGSYSLQTALVSSSDHLDNNYEWKDVAHIFHVVNRGRESFDGEVWIKSKMDVEIV